MQNMNPPAKIRRHELDWLRVLAFLLLIFFHAGMPFVEHHWHINNAETSSWLTALWSFFHSWRMPLLFTISGAGIWFAFGRRGALGFLKERSVRLLIPLFFGVLLIVPPQVYFEHLSQGVAYSSYVDFYPHFFDGIVFTGGNFTPNHLWFIYALFFYCIAALPVFLILRSSMGARALDRIAAVLSRRGGIYLTLIPLYFVTVLTQSISMEYVFEFSHLALVMTGFILASRDTILNAIENHRHTSLAITVLGGAAVFAMRLTTDTAPNPWIYYIAEVASVFSIILACIGYARNHLSFSNRFLRYTNEGVYPFYILHQTITVILAYHIVTMEIDFWLKFAMVTLGTAVFTVVIYHYLIRPYNWIRPFFGLKPNVGGTKISHNNKCAVSAH